MNSHTSFAKLRDILADLYSDEASIRRVIADAEIDVRQIAFDGRAVNTWHAVLTEANNTQKIDPLFAVILKEYAAYNCLREACHTYNQILECSGDLLVDSTAPTAGDPPFKGLRFFDISDANLFFGREQLTAELIEHLRHHHFLAVVGASGSGKSSVVRAGMLSVLQKGDIPLVNPKMLSATEGQWLAYVITPTAYPLAALAAALVPDTAPITAATELLDSFSNDTRTLHLYVQRLLSQGTAGKGAIHIYPFRSFPSQEKHCLLVIDQFEELFTLCHKQAERNLFINNLLTAASDDGVMTVVITLRADFYARCAEFDQLREYLERYQRYIGPLKTDELERAIEEPARKNGWEFEKGLIKLLVEDVSNEPGILPLLSHALLVTWQRRQGHTMTIASYIESGRVQGAIAKTADTVFAQLTEEQRAIARGIFLRLTVPADGTPDTRRRVKRDDLILRSEDKTLVETVLELLSKARLLTLFMQEVEVAHEALIREWPQLRSWLDENREGLRIHHRLTEAAQEWIRLEQDPGALYRGLHLEQAQVWAKEHHDELNVTEKNFLEASSEETMRVMREKEEAQFASLLADQERERADAQTQAAHQLRQRAIALLLALLMALIASGLATYFYNAERVARNQADEARTVAQTLHVAAETINIRTSSPQLGLLLALEAAMLNNSVTKHPFPAARNALRAQFDQWQHWQQTLLAHTKAVRAVRFGQTDQQLFSAGMDGRVLAWLLKGQNVQDQEIVALGGAVDAIAIHPTQNLLALGTSQGEIKIIHLDPGFVEAKVWQAHGNNTRILALTISEDGKLLISGGSDGIIRLWAVDSLQAALLTTIQLHDQSACAQAEQCWIRTLAISKNGQWLTAGSQNHQLYVWQLGPDATPLLALQIPLAASVRAIAIDRTCTWLAVGDESGTLQLYRLPNTHTGEAKSLQPYARLQLPPLSDIRSLDFSPVTNLLAIGDGSGIIGITSIDQGAYELHVIGHLDSAIESVAFSPSGNYVATGSFDHSVRVWQVESVHTEPLALRGHTGRVRSLNFRPGPLADHSGADVTTLLSASEDGTVRFWTLDNPLLPQQVITEVGNQILAADLSANGHWLATGGRDGRVRLYPSASSINEPVILGQHAGEIVAVAFSPNNHWLATGASDKKIYLWNVDDQAQLPQVLDNLQGGVLTVAFNANSSLLASGDEARRVKLWDITQSPPVVHTMYTHDDWVWSVAFSPDSHYLASTGADSMIQLTALQDFSAEQSIFAHQQRARILRFEPKSNLLASAGDDGVIKLWDPRNLGEPPEELYAHIGSVRALAFSADGRWLASSGDDAVIQVWTVQWSELQQMACARTGRNLSRTEWNHYFPEQPYHVTCPDLGKN